MRDQLIDAPEPVVLEWLFHEDSLTRRLTRLSHDGFSVTPLFEGWQRLRADECAALQLPEGSEGWVREVYLLGHGEKWVFARSVAGRAALAHDGLHMDELGTRSLGELLFSDRAFARGPLQICQYPRAVAARGRYDARTVGPSLVFQPRAVEHSGGRSVLANGLARHRSGRRFP